MTADGIVTSKTWSALIIQVKKRAAMATRFAVSKRNSSSVLANPVKGSRWMESSDRKRTVRSEASNTLFRSTFHLSSWMGLSVRSRGRHWSAACRRDRYQITAVSCQPVPSDRCNTTIKSFGGGCKSQSLARPFVELPSHSVELCLRQSKLGPLFSGGLHGETFSSKSAGTT
jgi:hypothetical protein